MEIIWSHHPNVKVDLMREHVREWESRYRALVPSLKFEDKDLRSWADK